MGKIVLITGVSGSGKTTLQEELISRDWYKPINYSTRKPRNDEELDEYVFISKSQFCKKLLNGDFIEFTTYGNNLYGVPKYGILKEDGTLQDKDFAIIVDPIGRIQLIKFFEDRDLKYTEVFIEVDKETIKDRLIVRGDSKDEIEKRLTDFNWFKPTDSSIILDGTLHTAILADLFDNF